ncbi:MAG: transketolase, partial [Pseudomonadales bacterium]
VVDHNTYVFLGDGCLMEGISHEVCSLAGTQQLGKLIAFYDDNGISIDGEVDGWFTDDTAARFRAYGWQVIDNVDGHDADAIKQAIEQARADTQKPSLLCCKTVIGYGSPKKSGTAGAHGSPLGEEEIVAARAQLGWQHGAFEVPDDIYAGWDARQRGQAKETEWQQRFDAYRQAHPELAAEFERRVAGELPAAFAAHAENYALECQRKAESPATRKASQNCLDAYGPLLPELMGGSADLAGSNNTIWKGSVPVSSKDAAGNYIYYGVREFGMSAIMNGIALHGGFIPYGATFLVFMEYARNAVRMAAIMRQRTIFVYTHDSIGLGEDGPTHQPVEQLASLRSTPNLSTWRPCDTVESAVAWRAALENKQGPAALIFTRQGLPHQNRDSNQVAAIARGGYVLHDTRGEPDAIVIATGSEVGIAMQAAQQLQGEGIAVRVVSMPCTDVFDAQDATYRDAVLPPQVRARVAVEASHVDYWRKYVGLDGAVVGMQSFGESAPAAALFEHFDITANAVAKAVRGLL